MRTNHWISIWTSPRATIAAIVSENPNRSLWTLASIFGFSEVMYFAQSAALGSWMQALPILGVGIVLAPFVGYALIAIWSWLLMHTGRWLKGSGSFQDVRAAYAWSCVPLVFNILIWFALVGLFQERLFLNAPTEPSLTPGQAGLLFILMSARLTFIIWSLVLYFNALAEVHHFSVLRAIGCAILSGIILGIASGILWTGLLLLSGAAT